MRKARPNIAIGIIAGGLHLRHAGIRRFGDCMECSVERGFLLECGAYEKSMVRNLPVSNVGCVARAGETVLGGVSGGTSHPAEVISRFKV